MEKTVLDMQGGTCTSCSIAIEHFAKRLQGISRVEVDRGQSRIYLEHDGDEANVNKVIEMVQRIGYDAWPSSSAAPSNEV